VHSTAWFKDLRVTADGTGVVSHVGTALLRMLADRAGLTTALSGALAEPKGLRYRILHTTARLTRGQRRRQLRIPATWPWATQITAAFDRIAAIPAPG
jgi:hypothetical protein